MKDPRIKPTPKVAASLNIPYWNPMQKVKKGVGLYVKMIQKEPNVGKFPAKKQTKPRQNY